jgi:mRNA-decapping enzyme subunit 2
LGTPATHKPREASFSEQSRETSRSRIGSMTSVRSGMSSGQQTPTEAKDMMLGYLNGVLQKEGLRGSGKKG